MPVDLNALSREVAAAGSDWMVPGVRILLDGHRAVRIVMPGRIFVEETGRHLGYTPASTDIPDLRDRVTVNALLGNGQAWRRIIGGGVAWVASVDLVHERTEDDRTAAICRAWIAARGKR